MLLSIIIPTWNTAKITNQCLLSIRKYLHSTDFEIIVFDNGSQDNTEKLISTHKNIQYLKSDKNLGFSKANNLAANNAKGDFFLFLNSDMKLIDNSILKMIDYLKEHKNVGLIGPQFLNTDYSPQPSVFPPQTVINAFKEFWLNIPSYSKFLPKNDIPQSVWSISGGAVLIKKNLYKQVGGWDEKYFFYYEDLDLCRKIRKLNMLIIYFPGSKIIHHHGASGKNIANSENQWRRLIKSSVLYHGKFYHYLINAIIWSGQKLHRLLG